MAFEGSFSASQIVDPREWTSGDKVPLWVPTGGTSLLSYGMSTGTVPTAVLNARRPPPTHAHNDNRVRRWQSKKPRDAEGTLMSVLSGYERSLRAAPDQSILNHHSSLRIARLVKKNVAEAAKAKGLTFASLETTSTAEEDKEAHAVELRAMAVRARFAKRNFVQWGEAVLRSVADGNVEALSKALQEKGVDPDDQVEDAIFDGDDDQNSVSSAGRGGGSDRDANARDTNELFGSDDEDDDEDDDDDGGQDEDDASTVFSGDEKKKEKKKKRGDGQKQTLPGKYGNFVLQRLPPNADIGHLMGGMERRRLGLNLPTPSCRSYGHKDKKKQPNQRHFSNPTNNKSSQLGHCSGGGHGSGGGKDGGGGGGGGGGSAEEDASPYSSVPNSPKSSASAGGGSRRQSALGTLRASVAFSGDSTDGKQSVGGSLRMGQLASSSSSSSSAADGKMSVGGSLRTGATTPQRLPPPLPATATTPTSTATHPPPPQKHFPSPPSSFLDAVDPLEALGELLKQSAFSPSTAKKGGGGVPGEAPLARDWAPHLANCDYYLEPGPPDPESPKLSSEQQALNGSSNGEVSGGGEGGGLSPGKSEGKGRGGGLGGGGLFGEEEEAGGLHLETEQQENGEGDKTGGGGGGISQDTGSSKKTHGGGGEKQSSAKTLRPGGLFICKGDTLLHIILRNPHVGRSKVMASAARKVAQASKATILKTQSTATATAATKAAPPSSSAHFLVAKGAASSSSSSSSSSSAPSSKHTRHGARANGVGRSRRQEEKEAEEAEVDVLSSYGLAPKGRICKGVHADMARLALDRGFGWTARNGRGERPADVAAVQQASDGWGKGAALKGAGGDGSAPFGKSALSPGPTPAARAARRHRRLHLGVGLDAGPTAGVGVGGATMGSRVRGGGANLGGRLKWFDSAPPPVFSWTLSNDPGSL